ncbi:related to 2-succinylbenzoate-CoA ligase [Phialocephala subalpina]|uniref:Related to 2-succinylbenzoate-CoA ligase n=1 Tax=Phialocephala subalpina TaxID=576137 RepID=A0A1L7X078_9HELO|nr:related to 2-succinylbenzoate-CoA ligase [Phialocephala subalpina]
MATLFTSLSSHVESTALIIPSAPCPTTLSHRELFQLSLKFQQRLANIGISPKHTIAISLPNTIEFAVAFLATTFQRAGAAPLNPAYKQEEFEFCLQGPEVPLLLLPKGAVAENGEAVRAATRCGTAMGEIYWDGSEVYLCIMDFGKTKKRFSVELETPVESDIAVVLHTRESAGQLKAIPLTHQTLCKTMAHEVETYHLSTSDRAMLIMPLYHIHGLVAAFLAPLSCGSSIIMPSRFSAQDFWQDFKTYFATWYTAIPPMHQALFRALPSLVPKMRFVRSCSSSLPENVKRRMEFALSAPVLEGNAMSDLAHETASSPTSTSSTPGTQTHKHGSVGRANGLEMVILDPNENPLPRGEIGQVCVLGSSIAPGYTSLINMPGFTKSGYFKTGDRGFIDEEGFMFLTATNKRRMSVVRRKGGITEVVRNEKEYRINLSVGEVAESENEKEEREVKVVRMGGSEKRYSSDESIENEKEVEIKVVKRRRFSSLPRLLTSCFR